MDLQTFMHSYYRPIHGPLVLSICIFGIITQALNIAVLTRRAMRTMPSNILLAGLSVAQLILLTNYIIGTAYALSDSTCNHETKTYSWLTYLLFNVNVNVVFHTIALVHTTLLAVFRYAAIAFPIRSRKLVSDRGAKLAVLSAFVIVPVACSTFYANSAVVQRPQNNDTQDCLKSISPLYRLKYTENRALRDYNFIFFGAVCKLLPCGIMIMLSSLLLLELKRVHIKRLKLTSGNNDQNRSTRPTPKNAFNKITSNASLGSNHENGHHRQTTVMLVTVVLLLVCVEFPQGIMNFLTVMLDNYEFSIRIYYPLGDLFEMLTVLYSSVNFIIYCIMSSQFRKMFKELFYFRRLTKGGDDSILDRSATSHGRRFYSGCSTMLTENGHRSSLLTLRDSKLQVNNNRKENNSNSLRVDSESCVLVCVQDSTIRNGPIDSL